VLHFRHRPFGFCCSEWDVGIFSRASIHTSWYVPGNNSDHADWHVLRRRPLGCGLCNSGLIKYFICTNHNDSESYNPLQVQNMSTFSESVGSLTDTLANLNPPWALPGTLVLGGIGICYVVFRQSGLPLPPGPSISWLGLSGKDSVKMPQAYAWLVFADWQKKFGRSSGLVKISALSVSISISRGRDLCERFPESTAGRQFCRGSFRSS
jgi:hypothetical protein